MSALPDCVLTTIALQILSNMQGHGNTFRKLFTKVQFHMS